MASNMFSGKADSWKIVKTGFVFTILATSLVAIFFQKISQTEMTLGCLLLCVLIIVAVLVVNGMKKKQHQT
jgi:hypothetical protein